MAEEIKKEDKKVKKEKKTEEKQKIENKAKKKEINKEKKDEKIKSKAEKKEMQKITIINADGLVIGRLASNVAKRLLNGEEVAIVNAEKSIVIGNKSAIVEHYKLDATVGDKPRKGPHFPRMPDRLLKRTVRGMLPYQKHKGKIALNKLKVYIGVPKEIAGEMQTVEDAKKISASFLTLGEICKYLGSTRRW